MELLLQPRLKRISNSRHLAALLSLFFLALCTQSALALDTASTDIPEPLKLENKPITFNYVLEGRPDPFVPFITEKAASASTSQVDMNEIVDSNDRLSGMQLFEPGQLNLVALMRSGSLNMAMVEDFTGKGYVISEGTKIGRRGVVKKIAPNTVVIEETAQTRAGKKIITEIVMILKKEGEE